MEPKFKEQVKRNPNENLKNTPISQWPTEEKINAIAGGPLYVAANSGVFSKIKEALNNFYTAWKDYNGKIVPPIPKAGFTIDRTIPFKNGGRIS